MRVNQDCSLRQQPGTAIAIDPLDPDRMLVAQNDSRNRLQPLRRRLELGRRPARGATRRRRSGSSRCWTARPRTPASIRRVAWDSQGNSYVAGDAERRRRRSPAERARRREVQRGHRRRLLPLARPARRLPGVPLAAARRPDERQRPEHRARQADDRRGRAAPRARSATTSTSRGRGTARSRNRRTAAGDPRRQPDLLQPVDRRRRDLDAPDRDQRPQLRHLPDLRVLQRPGLGHGRRPGRVDLCRVRESRLPEPRRAAPVREVPGRRLVRRARVLDEPGRASRTSTAATRRARRTNGCPFGRQCLPPNGYAVNEAMSISASVDSSRQPLHRLVRLPQQHEPELPRQRGDRRRRPATTTSSTRTRPTAARRGRSRSASRRASNPRFGETAQWLPWSAMAPNGHLWVAFYDRSFGDCEYTGCNDVTAAEITNPASASPTYRLLPRDDELDAEPDRAENNPIEAGFIGDRMRIETDSREPGAHRMDGHPPARGLGARGGRLLRAGSGAARTSPPAPPPSSATVPPPPPPPPPPPASARSAAAATASACALPRAPSGRPAARRRRRPGSAGRTALCAL